MQMTMACLGVISLAGCSPGSRSSTPRYDAVAVQRGNIIQLVTATGSLSAVVSVDVGSQISGTIKALNVDFNSTVKKGDIVAELDSALYKASVHQAQGELASAKAARELSRQTMERKKVLVPQRAATQADLDKAVAELAQAEALVMIKEGVLEKAQTDLGYCRIVAPVDGIVISRKVDTGQTLAAAMTTPVLFTIAQDITKMHISATISEADIGMVAEGQSAEFSVDAFPGEVFSGKVVQVRKAPSTTNNVVTYQTIIDVDNPNQKLFPGMTAEVSLVVASRENVLVIPNSALRFTPPYGSQLTRLDLPRPVRSQRRVYVLEPDEKTLRPVIINCGITNGVVTEVLTGLAEKDRVVVAAAVEKLKPAGFVPPAPQ